MLPTVAISTSQFNRRTSTNFEPGFKSKTKIVIVVPALMPRFRLIKEEGFLLFLLRDANVEVQEERVVIPNMRGRAKHRTVYAKKRWG